MMTRIDKIGGSMLRLGYSATTNLGASTFFIFRSHSIFYSKFVVSCRGRFEKTPDSYHNEYHYVQLRTYSQNF